MSASSNTLALEAFAERASLLALGRSLVGADGPDAVQDALVQALRREQSVRNPVAWVRRVLRNEARMRLRTAARRRTREQAARWDAESVDPEKALLHSEIIDALQAAWSTLDEPYREALRLRFEEGLSSPEIGVRQACPTNTASWRVREGLTRLRTRLDQRFGDRRQWFGGLVAVTGLPSDVHAAATSTNTMKIIVTTAVLGLTTAAVGGSLLVPPDAEQEAQASIALQDQTVGASEEDTSRGSASDLFPQSPSQTLHDADVVGVSFDPGERAYGVGIRTSGEGMSACGDEIEALAANARDVYPGCRHAARYEPEAEFAVQAKFEMIEGRSQLSAVAVASAQTPESEQLARCLVDSLLGEEGHEYTPGFTGVLEFRFWPLEPDEYDAAAIVNRVRSEGRLEIDGANLPRRGSADVTPSVIPSVTMVECVDLECPFTRKAAPVVDQVLDVYGDRIAYAVLQNPLAMHEGATLKALAMVAAHQQGRFWEVFDYFHTHIMPMGDEEMHAMAQGLGLDADRFMTALHDPATVKEVERQQQICLSNNGKGTPTFFINGLRLPGAQDFEIFRRLIDDELGGDDHPNGRSISN